MGLAVIQSSICVLMPSPFQPQVRFRQEDVGWAAAGMHTAAPGHTEQGVLSVAGCQAGFCPDCPCQAVASGGSQWPEGCWKGAWSCQGFQTAVCCNPNSVKLQKICVRWILSPFWSFGLEIHTVCWTQKSQDGFWEIAFSSLLRQRLFMPEKQHLNLLKYQGWVCFTKMHQKNMELHTPESTPTPCQGVRILSYLHGNLLTWPRKSSGAFPRLGEVWLQGSPACGRAEGGSVETLTLSSHWIFRLWAVTAREKQ